MRYENLKKKIKEKSASKQRLKLQDFSMYLWGTNFMCRGFTVIPTTGTESTIVKARADGLVD